MSASLDGGQQLGMLAMRQAVQLALQKAEQSGLALIGMYNTSSSEGALGCVNSHTCAPCAYATPKQCIAMGCHARIAESPPSLSPALLRPVCSTNTAAPSAARIAPLAPTPPTLLPVCQCRYYVEQLAQQGYVGIMLSQSPEYVAPHGSSQALFGTNPIAVACPQAPGRPPLVVDFATSATTLFDLVAARESGNEVCSLMHVSLRAAFCMHPSPHILA